MLILNFLISRKKQTANIAKQRLHIIVTKRKTLKIDEIIDLPELHKELLQTISKYMPNNKKITSIKLEKENKNKLILKLNIKVNTKK